MDFLCSMFSFFISTCGVERTEIFPGRKTPWIDGLKLLPAPLRFTGLFSRFLSWKIQNTVCCSCRAPSSLLVWWWWWYGAILSHDTNNILTELRVQVVVKICFWMYGPWKVEYLFDVCRFLVKKVAALKQQVIPSWWRVAFIFFVYFILSSWGLSGLTTTHPPPLPAVATIVVCLLQEGGIVFHLRRHKKTSPKTNKNRERKKKKNWSHTKSKGASSALQTTVEPQGIRGQLLCVDLVERKGQFVCWESLQDGRMISTPEHGI